MLKALNTNELTLDEIKIRKAVQNGLPLSVTTYTLPHEVEVYIEEILTAMLKQTVQEHLKDYIVYMVKELMGNAKKANTKRVYFSERGLDLNKSDDYKIGMADFRKTTLSNINHYLQLQKEEGLRVKLTLQIKNNIINIEVRNNAQITNYELVRIHEKLAHTRQFFSLEDAVTNVLDDLEGAGLGLIILVLMLKKMSLSEDCFGIIGTEKETIARIVIPIEQTRTMDLSVLSSAIVENVNSLPQFPENILKIQELINDPGSKMSDIARQISIDPALTAELLKIVNSARYMLSKKVDSISEAVRIVGIKVIKNLLYSYGVQKILGNDTNEKKVLWEHSYKTAFYAYNLAKNNRKDPNFAEDVYLGGILHDIGKIIFSSVHPELLEKIKEIAVKKNIDSSAFEALASGMNHAEIGALISEKWNFPEHLVSAIRFHHDPADAPVNDQDLVCAVYIANMLCGLEDETVTFDQFDPAILESFGINSQKQVETLLNNFIQEFMQAQ